MDILHPQAVNLENYRIVARVLARLVEPECMALYHLPKAKLVACTNQTVSRLQSSDPMLSTFPEAAG